MTTSGHKGRTQMSEMPPERVAAIEQLAMDAWQMITSRTRSVDDVAIALSMLLVQAVFNMPDPKRGQAVVAAGQSICSGYAGRKPWQTAVALNHAPIRAPLGGGTVSPPLTIGLTPRSRVGSIRGAFSFGLGIRFV